MSTSLWTGTSPLIFSIPFSFPIFPSIVVVQEWQVIPSMQNFKSDTPLPVVWDGDKVGSFCMGLLGEWLSRSIKLDTTSLKCCDEVREGTKVTVRPICVGFFVTSRTPRMWDNFSRASCWAAAFRPKVGMTWVSVETGVAVLDSGVLDSKPMSSMASDRDSGLCWLLLNMTVAFFCSKDTYKRKVETYTHTYISKYESIFKIYERNVTKKIGKSKSVQLLLTFILQINNC